MPYRGTGPALQDLVAGQIDMIIDQASNCLPQVRQGTIKAFAVTAPERLASAADIPTTAEAGLPGLQMEVWSGMWVPHGTPRAIVEKLNAAVVAALAEPAVREKLAGVGLDGPPRDQMTPAGARRFSKGRSREMVAHHQGGERHGGVRVGVRFPCRAGPDRVIEGQPPSGPSRHS